jgi:hypothetical protein
VSYPYQLILTNPGAESGDASGWTADAGSLAAQTTQGGVNPHSGSYFFTAYQSAAMEVHQDIALDASLLDDVDANLLRLTFSAWQAGYSADADTGRLRVTFYDGSSTLLAIADTATYDGGASWVQKTIETFVPPGTRTIRLVMIATRASGTYCDAYFDDLEAHLDLADKYPYPLLIANPGGESGTSGWTNVTSTLTTRSSNPNPRTGAAYFHSTSSGAASECYQDIALPADVLDEVDASLLTFEFAAWQAGYTDADTGTMRFQFLDGSDGDLGTTTGSPYDGTSTWAQNTLSAAVPVGTRKVRLTLLGTRAAGTSLDAYWDDLTATLNVTQPPDTHLEAFVLPDSTVRMVWTADYLNGQFNIERRESGGSWGTLSSNVTPGSSVDASPYAVGEYRIANVIGGVTTYSNAVTVTLANLPAWAAYDNLDLWLSARDIALADDAEIPVLYDRSGNNHDVTAVGAKPTFKATGLADLNDLPTVYAPAGTDGYDGGAACAYGGATGLTVFVVMDLTGTEASHHIIGREDNLNYGWLVGVEGNDGRAMFKIATGTTSRCRRDSSDFSLWKVPAVLCCRYNGSTGEQSVWVNGVLDNGALDGSIPATINRDGPALDVFKGDWGVSADGYVPEIIVFAEAISEAKRQAITAELLTRYDLPTLTYVDEQEVSGEQGVAYDGTYWYVNGTNEIRKYDGSWSQVAINSSPRTGTTLIHLGDPDYYDGILFVPGNDGGSPSHTYILKFSATDLSRLSVTDLGETEGSSALTVDAGRGIIWSISYAATISVVHKHNLSDLSDAGHLTLSESIPYVQGIKYNSADGMLYVAAGATATKPSLYRVDPETGTVRRTFLLAGEAESEGIDISGSTLAWHRVPSAKVVYIYDLAFGGAALPTAPTITAVPTGAGEITVTQTGGGEGATSIALYRAASATDLPIGAPGAGATLVADPWTSPTVQTGLGNGVTRYYAAYATNANGTVRSNVASATTLAAPGVPVITGTANSDTQITITVTTPGSGATDHELWIAPDNDGVPGTFVLQADGLGATPSPVAVTGLDPETTYWFLLIAINAAGSTNSAPIPVDTLRPSLRVVYVTQTTAGVILDYDSDAVEVQFQTALTAETDFDPTVEDEIETDADDGNPFGHEITGLTAATAYRVRARSRTTPGGAWGEWTAAVTFTTSAAAGETVMGGFTAPTGFVLSGTIYPAWNLAFSPAHPQDWTATELAIAEAGGGWTVLATTATLPAGKIGTYSAGIDLSAYDDGLMRLRLKGQRSTGHTGTDYLVFYNNSAGSLTQTEEDFDQECWDARSVEGTGEYVLGRDGGPWENWPTLWSGNAGFYLPCYPATTDKIITSIRATAKAKAAASGDSGYLWWLNNEITGSGASLEIYNGDGVLRAKLTIIWGATWAVLPCENSQNLVGVIHATFDSPTESQWPHSVVHHAGTIGTQSNWYGRCPVWGDTVGMSISLNHVSGDTWHYAAGASSRGSQHWEGDFTLEGGIGCGAYAMVRPFRLGPSGFKGFVSANLVGLSMSGTEDCEGGDPPVASSSFEPEPPTFDVQTDCYDALLTVDSPAPIASVRYQITDVSGAVLVDTGWDPPAYVADEQGGPSWVAYHLQQGLDPGSYMALISAQIDSVTYESYPLPFTILGLSVDYWGGWDNRTVTA